VPLVISPTPPRRARKRAARTRWERFAIAVAATTVLVILFGAGPLELSGGDARPEAAAAVHLVDTDTAGATDAGAGSTADATASTTSSSTTSTTTTTTTTVPPTTTTTRPKLRVPGLGLPAQPEPQPVSLPPTSSAPVFSRIPTTNKVIFLGIDDGLVRDPAVADLLRQANIPFTMFLVKGEADAGVDYFRQLQQYGGVVESHTITHPDLTTLSYGNVQNEVCGTLDDYQSLYGRRPTLFRPPYGNTNANVQAVAASCGLKAVVLWKGSTNDGRLDLQDGTQLTPGDVILMHFRNDLVTNLQKVFDTCRQQGFAIASLEDYLPS
jgi:peptidoglycan/xylan/chitin deacetylase (PgdA/CDA1 family)